MSSGNLCRALMMLVLTALFVALPSIARAEGPSIDPHGITGDEGGSIDDNRGSIDPNG